MKYKKGAIKQINIRKQIQTHKRLFKNQTPKFLTLPLETRTKKLIKLNLNISLYNQDILSSIRYKTFERHSY